MIFVFRHWLVNDRLDHSLLLKAGNVTNAHCQVDFLKTLLRLLNAIGASGGRGGLWLEAKSLLLFAKVNNDC